jgi:hypothetical protein
MHNQVNGEKLHVIGDTSGILNKSKVCPHSQVACIQAVLCLSF